MASLKIERMAAQRTGKQLGEAEREAFRRALPSGRRLQGGKQMIPTEMKVITPKMRAVRPSSALKRFR